jgi:glycosyltransferase involved in cell wall biosynthesis
MTGAQLSYALVTPARNEAENLSRLAGSLAAQTVLPSAWVIVDNDSTDATNEVAARLHSEHPWIELVAAPGEPAPVRGGPIVRAFLAGLAALDVDADVVVKLDADVSMNPEHFERLLDEFARDSRLGIASGACWEESGGEWRPQFVTRGHVRGAVRAYRRTCLEDVMPLEQRMGWDGIDEIKAQVAGWRTTNFDHLPFRHHRATGGRERRLSKWIEQGDMAHFMGYRPSYLVFRSLYRATQEPSAVAMIWGYARAAIQRRPRCADPGVRTWLRREQGLRRLPVRAREALGREAR